MPRDRRSRFLAAVLLAAIATTLFPPDIAFGDEPGVNLDQAIRLSLTNPKTLAGREAVSQARADARTASLFPNPSLSVEAGLLPLSRPYTVEEPGGPAELAGGITYPIDWLFFGKRAAGMASAGAAVEIAEAEYADLIRKQVEETTQAFFGVLEAEALLKVAGRTVASLEQVESALREAVASGGRPQVELSRARLELQSARREERSARSAAVAAKATLRALLGESEGTRDLVVVGSLDGALPARPLAIDEAFAVAAGSRPDILALRRRQAKAQRDEIVESRNAWPETALTFGVTHQFQRSIGALDVTAWGAALEVALPLFNRNQGNREKAASAVIQSAHELRAALVELRAEIEQAGQALGTALENAMDAAQTDLDLASRVRDSLQKAYEAGGRSFIEFLDAERSFRETYKAYITTRADYWRSLSRYEAALGKKVTP
jgi:cobalt-zinc-cadmium efflux system outer membrane protein